jgi:hypothetical protein
MSYIYLNNRFAVITKTYREPLSNKKMAIVEFDNGKVKTYKYTDLIKILEPSTREYFNAARVRNKLKPLDV